MLNRGDLAIPAADDAVLWCWTTHRFLPAAFPLLAAWGFEYKVTMTWVKDRLGVGSWLRSDSEFCLLAVRGRPVVDLTTQRFAIDCESADASWSAPMQHALAWIATSPGTWDGDGLCLEPS